MSDAGIRKAVLWAAKIAILIISAPATLGVVSNIYASGKVEPVILLGVDFLWVVKLAVLVMVEGAFLYFWQLVEDNRSLQTREESEQNTYIISAWLMYAILLGVGLLHGEGFGSLIFRFAMGLLMFTATNDKLQAMRKKYELERASGKRKSRKVRRAEATAEETLALYIIGKNIEKQKEAVDNQTVLLTQVGVVSAQKRILALNKMEVVEGEIILETRALPAGNPSTNPVPAPPAQPEAVSTPVVETNNDVVENECYTITKVGEDFVVSCKLCRYTVTKTAAESKNARTSAIRAASRHCGHHSKEEKEQAVVENSTNTVEIDFVDEQYVMYREVDDNLWIWECAICKESSPYQWVSKEDAQESYRVHAIDYQHIGNQTTVEKAYTPSDEITFSK
jgi:hypothetical protein